MSTKTIACFLHCIHNVPTIFWSVNPQNNNNIFNRFDGTETMIKTLWSKCLNNETTNNIYSGTFQALIEINGQFVFRLFALLHHNGEGNWNES